MADESLGTLIKTYDGKVYFISEEVLAGCEVSDEEAAGQLKSDLEDYGEVSGFAFKPGFEIAYATVPSHQVAGGFRGATFNFVPAAQLGPDVVACW